jgi:hypothetical protein
LLLPIIIAPVRVLLATAAPVATIHVDELVLTKVHVPMVLYVVAHSPGELGGGDGGPFVA